MKMKMSRKSSIVIDDWKQALKTMNDTKLDEGRVLPSLKIKDFPA